IARAKGIPFVASIDVQICQNTIGQNIIVDGFTGEVILSPSISTIHKYTEKKKSLRDAYQLLEKDVHLKAETKEGFLVGVYANIGGLDEMEVVHQYGGAGVGLFRSEYLLLQSG